MPVNSLANPVFQTENITSLQLPTFRPVSNYRRQMLLNLCTDPVMSIGSDHPLSGGEAYGFPARRVQSAQGLRSAEEYLGRCVSLLSSDLSYGIP